MIESSHHLGFTFHFICDGSRIVLLLLLFSGYAGCVAALVRVVV
jgi:hypothetical protein